MFNYRIHFDAKPWKATGEVRIALLVSEIINRRGQLDGILSFSLSIGSWDAGTS